MLKGRAPTKAEKEWMSKVADLGCIACLNEFYIYSEAAIHHIEGKTKEGAHFLTIGLCGAHHQTGGEGVALHHNKYRWEKRHGTQYELLEQTKRLINDH